MSKKIVLLIFSVFILAFLPSCQGDTVTIPKIKNGPAQLPDGSLGNCKDGECRSYGATPAPTPSATSPAPAGYSYSAPVISSNRDQVTFRFDGNGYRSSSLSYGGSYVAANRGGQVTLSGFPSGTTYVPARVTLDDGTVRSEEVKVELNYSSTPTPTPTPSVTSGAPVLYEPVYSQAARSFTARMGGANIVELRLRIAGQDLLAQLDKDLTVYGLQPNTRYEAEFWAKNSAGVTTSKSFSFTTLSDGSSGDSDFSTSQLIGSNWEIVNFSGVTSLLKKSEWLDNSLSNPRFQFNLKDSVSYHFKLTDATGRTAEGDWSNSVVVLENLGSASFPVDFAITAKSGSYNNTQIISGRIKRR